MGNSENKVLYSTYGSKSYGKKMSSETGSSLYSAFHTWMLTVIADQCTESYCSPA